MSDVGIFASVHLLRQSIAEFFLAWGNLSMQWGAVQARSPTHCLDESPAGYSWVGCSPAEPTCASPAKQIMPKQTLGGNRKPWDALLREAIQNLRL